MRHATALTATLGLTVFLLGGALASASAGTPCGVDKKWANECKAIKKQAESYCEPERMLTRSPEGAGKWIAARRDAGAFEKTVAAFAKKRPECLTEKVSKVCMFRQKHLDQCTGLAAKFEKAWPEKVTSERKEVMRHLPTLEKKSKTEPKETWAYYNNAKRYLTKVFGAVLMIEPTNKEFLGYKERFKAVSRVIVNANLDRLAKVKCPKPGKPNAKLQKTLKKAYKGFLGKLSYPVKAHKLGLDKAVIKETDISGTKWEYAYTTTCIEETADKKDPARCSVQSVSFKRSKPPGKKWSEWSFRGHGAKDDAMLCKNLK